MVSSEVFGKIDHAIWNFTWRWSRRRHPNLGGLGVVTLPGYPTRRARMLVKLNLSPPPLTYGFGFSKSKCTSY
ncbi:group II intron maturase-specific domain-containing protein [Desulfamplus magnetovallimortis]|uniref:group II intron maturase-specific domain-containing protein n=1 Tax=Desulfamplus magnetovallimortis TaxID=1246637 RepID=UPI001C9560E5